MTLELVDVRPETLTPRERQMVAMIMTGEGATYERLGQLMHIRPNTVKFYVAAILRKFNVASQVALVSYAWQNGVLVGGEWYPKQ